jgi:hypothetical protein
MRRGDAREGEDWLEMATADPASYLKNPEGNHGGGGER